MESQLKAGDYRLDDPKTKETVNAAVQKRKDFIDKVESAYSAWQQQQREEETERETQRLETERIAKEKHRDNLIERMRNAIELDNTYSARRGFSQNAGFYGYYLNLCVTYGTALLYRELERVAGELHKAGQLVDKVPLEQAVDAVRERIAAERGAIAQETFFQFYDWRVSKEVADYTSGKASFTMTINTNYIVARIEQEFIEEISLSVPGVTATLENSSNNSQIVLHVSGDVESVKELALNPNNYTVRIWFNNARHRQQAVPNRTSGTSSYGIETQIDVLRLEVIHINERNRIRQGAAHAAGGRTVSTTPGGYATEQQSATTHPSGGSPKPPGQQGGSGQSSTPVLDAVIQYGTNQIPGFPPAIPPRPRLFDRR